MIRFSIFLLICISCAEKNPPLNDFQIYKWKAVTFSSEVYGESDTTIVADTLINGLPINIDSTNTRFELYQHPSKLEYVSETDTLTISKNDMYIGFYHSFFESWYNEKIGFLLSIYPHARMEPYVWSYELSEIIDFKNGTKSAITVDSLVATIQEYRYQRLVEMEKLYGK